MCAHFGKKMPTLVELILQIFVVQYLTKATKSLRIATQALLNEYFFTQLNARMQSSGICV